LSSSKRRRARPSQDDAPAGRCGAGQPPGSVSSTSFRPTPILLTGATGYIGGRLLRRFEEEGRPVRCLTRRPEVLVQNVRPSTTIVAGDLLAPETLDTAFEGVSVAYYLVHSMAAGGRFEVRDRRAAAHFAAAARAAGVSQIVYLGGLGSEGDLSRHLASRHEVGEILRASGVATLELRSSIVIGSGSASYEAVRAVVELLPLVLAPRSAETFAQPIAIEDVVKYLLAASRLELPLNTIVEIGGRDTTTFVEIMREYARQRGLRRKVVTTRLATQRLSRWFLSIATPVYGPIAASMLESMRNETTVHNTLADQLFETRPRGLPEAIKRALRNEDKQYAETRWSDALPTDVDHWGGASVGQRRVFTRSLRVAWQPHDAFAPIQRIGGTTGWYAANWFWLLRGLLDTLRGGVGLRRGRRDATDLRIGDTVDFWRVERFEPDRLLRLKAEMKIPGRLWLQFEVDRQHHSTQVRQTTIFDAAGLVGLAYWYTLYPLHRWVFARTLAGIERAMRPGPECRPPRQNDSGATVTAPRRRRTRARDGCRSPVRHTSTPRSLAAAARVLRMRTHARD
jgi:uncharacterized protein YbjT (DUF2867 family)